jgi:predicted nucleotidyltransferase
MKQEAIERIKKKFPEIEQEHNVKILYAVESGSRAWGFESTDSDYDIRFIYAHAKNWYLNILPKRDVIEYPIEDDLDFSGWDLRKTFFLLNKSNPVLFEWLKSPIVYFRNDYFFNTVDELSKSYFSPISSIYHYLHMANGNFRQYLQNDEVKTKKYFYVLRPILACLWIEKFNESPPMEFDMLLTLINNQELLDKIVELLSRKKSGIELGIEPKIIAINNFIEAELHHFEESVDSFNPRKKPESNILEEGFIKIIENCAY